MRIVQWRNKEVGYEHATAKRSMYKDVMDWTGLLFRIYAEEGDTAEDLEAKAREIAKARDRRQVNDL